MNSALLHGLFAGSLQLDVAELHVILNFFLEGAEKRDSYASEEFVKDGGGKKSIARFGERRSAPLHTGWKEFKKSKLWKTNLTEWWSGIPKQQQRQSARGA
eukprot:3201241-Amphidinium_carterae.1